MMRQQKKIQNRLAPLQKLLIFIYVMVILLFFHHYIFRPIILDWGATTELREHIFSGDEFTAGSSHTRAVLINASPEEIWPWLNQIGQDRAGFYSYQWLENVFRAEMKNIYIINPEFQMPRQYGDTIWLATKDHYNGGGYQVLAEIIPFKSFVMVGGSDFQRIRNGGKARGSWAFYLHSVAPNQTWLVVRSSEGDIGFANRVLRYFFFEVPHFIMERKMLLTIRKLVEQSA
jgi:hypothetical protein